MNMELSRRQFMKGAGAGMAGTTLGAFGFGDVEAAHAAAIRPFKLANTTETRNTCTYCSVACGDHPVFQGRSDEGRERRDHPHRGRRRITRPIAARSARRARRCSTSCNRRPASSTRRSASPAPTRSNDVSWDDALDRIARLLKDDRDKNFVAKNDDGVTVNRWLTTGFLAASATTNETAFATYKVVRSTGMLAFDNQARV